MNFDKAVSIILPLEGGYVFDSHDPGGETNMGISRRAYPNVDIKGLTKEGAILIYRMDYWEPLKPMLLPARLRLCLFDCAINQGLPRAIRILQGSVGAKQDGILGRETLDAAKTYGEIQALNNMLLLRLGHYIKLPTFARYGEGWMRRLLHITLESMR